MGRIHHTGKAEVLAAAHDNDDVRLGVRDQVDARSDIVAVSPVVSGPAFAHRGNAVESIAVVGMDPPRYQRIIPVEQDLIAGSLRVGAGDAVIGKLLADDLGATVGDRFRLVAGNEREAELRIAGIFELGVRELDERYVYLDLKQAQSLLDLPGGVTLIDLTVPDIFSADRIARRIGAHRGGSRHLDNVANPHRARKADLAFEWRSGGHQLAHHRNGGSSNARSLRECSRSRFCFNKAIVSSPMRKCAPTALS